LFLGVGKMNQRLREFDFIRVTAAISVIAIHITAPYSQNSILGHFWNQLMRYAVPMFIIISGLLLYYSSSMKAFSYTQFLSKRFKKILFPYILWTIIYFIFKNRSVLLALLKRWDEHALILSKNLLLGTGYPHLYFVIIILQLYLLFPIIKTLLEKYRYLTLILSLLTTVFFQTAIYLNLLGMVKLPKIFIPYYIFFPTWIFYFIFGMYFASNIDNWKKHLCSRKLSIAISWALSFILLTIDNKFTNTFSSSLKPSVMLYCFTSFFLFYILFSQEKLLYSKLWSIIDWISSQSFLIYLSHLLVLNVIKINIKSLGAYKLLHGSIGMIFLFFATLVFTTIFVYIISLTPLAGLLGGIRIRPNHVWPDNKASLSD
jgi:surface polysaccharide O-acyltransferase-like enzyme